MFANPVLMRWQTEGWTSFVLARTQLLSNSLIHKSFLWFQHTSTKQLYDTSHIMWIGLNKTNRKPIQNHQSKTKPTTSVYQICCICRFRRRDSVLPLASQVVSVLKLPMLGRDNWSETELMIFTSSIHLYRKNVCHRRISYNAYVRKSDRRIGYENYRACCKRRWGKCWSRCTRTR